LVTSSEEIFSFKFARQTGQGSGLPRIMNHLSSKLYNFGGAYAHYEMQQIHFIKSGKTLI